MRPNGSQGRGVTYMHTHTCGRVRVFVKKTQHMQVYSGEVAGFNYPNRAAGRPKASLGICNVTVITNSAVSWNTYQCIDSVLSNVRYVFLTHDILLLAEILTMPLR